MTLLDIRKMPNQELRYAIGVDLGATKSELGIVDETGKVHQHLRLDTLAEEGDLVVERQILEGILTLQRQGGVPLLGIGVGVAGQIQAETGVVLFAPNLKWDCFPLQTSLQRSLNMPIRVLNDLRAITLGECLYGAGRGCRDLLCVFVGTGIGGGVVSNGRLLTGSTNIFGEIGHLTIDFNGPLCTCGKQGCFEAFAGGWGIAARAREAIQREGQGLASQCLLKLAGSLQGVTAKIVVEAYRQDDPMAKILIHEMQKACIAGCASLVNAYNPSRFILGGGLIDGMPEIIQLIDEGVKRGALQAATHSLEIVKAQLGKQAGVIGSAASIFSMLNMKRDFRD